MSMEIGRDDGRTTKWLRPLTCSCNILNRAHGSASWSQGRGADGTWNHHICYTWSNVSG